MLGGVLYSQPRGGVLKLVAPLPRGRRERNKQLGDFLEDVTEYALWALRGIEIVIQHERFRDPDPTVQEHSHYPLSKLMPDFRIILRDLTFVEAENKNLNTHQDSAWIEENILNKSWSPNSRRVIITPKLSNLNMPARKLLSEYHIIETVEQVQSSDDIEAIKLLIRNLGDLFKGIMVYNRQGHILPPKVLPFGNQPWRR